MRLAPLVIVSLCACGGYGSGPPGPRTAAERAAAEREASTEEAVSGEGKAWGGWRYQGARDDCFYVVERRCFTTLADACTAAACEDGHACTTTGAGPAVVACK